DGDRAAPPLGAASLGSAPRFFGSRRAIGERFPTSRGLYLCGHCACQLPSSGFFPERIVRGPVTTAQGLDGTNGCNSIGPAVANPSSLRSWSDLCLTSFQPYALVLQSHHSYNSAR